ncbi:hypothetical protein SEA_DANIELLEIGNACE_72 [Arthrobacter phage DanielleIgnace]|nr:hypothetical protein SEA_DANIELLEIGNACE_72 [Arthrobacter phage DanielleIgnace]
MEVSGKIEIDGKTTEFMLTEEGSYTQWGADTPILGERVDLLEKLGEAYRDWCEENLCSECGDKTLDDGEGYDGKCGNCADKAEGGDEE